MVLIFVLFSTNGVEAQGFPRATLRDSNLVARNVIRTLFDGIPLSKEEQAEATAIVKATWRRQFLPKSGTVAEQVKRAQEINSARDSALKRLLASQPESTLFDRNAEALAAGVIIVPRRATPR